MPTPSFIQATPASHREALISLNVEYMTWVQDGLARAFGVEAPDVLGMPVHDYVCGVIDKVCGDPPPAGVFYLIEVDGQLAGMGGLRRLRDGVAELKRLYIRPAFRGQQLGEAALRRLIADAHRFGYGGVCLDSAPFMTSAQRLYEACGFTDCPPYAGTEVPTAWQIGWRFMACNVKDPSPC